jgi:hypothetical protein
MQSPEPAPKVMVFLLPKVTSPESLALRHLAV